MNGSLFLLAAAALWSTGGFLTKFMPFSALTVACVRGLVGASLQLWVSRKNPLKITKPVLLTAVCYLGETCLFMFANKMTSAGSAIALQNTAPLFIILMSYLVLNQKPSVLDSITATVLCGGIMLSMLDTFHSGDLAGSSPMLGNVLAILSGVFYAGIFFTSRLPGANPLHSTILGNLMYLFFLPFVFMDPAVMTPSMNAVSAPLAWGAMIFMGLFQTGLAWLCFSIGIRSTSSLKASFIVMIEPVLNPILAFLLLGEAMTPLSVVGSMLVIAAVLCNNVLSQKELNGKHEGSEQ